MIASTPLTPRTRTFFQTARTRALHAVHTHQKLYGTQTNFVDRGAVLPAPLQFMSCELQQLQAVIVSASQASTQKHWYTRLGGLDVKKTSRTQVSIAL